MLEQHLWALIFRVALRQIQCKDAVTHFFRIAHVPFLQSVKPSAWKALRICSHTRGFFMIRLSFCSLSGGCCASERDAGGFT